MSNKTALYQEQLKAIFQKSVESVQPVNLIQRYLTFEDNVLKVNDRQYVLRKPCYVVGFGKAVLGMAAEVDKLLGKNIEKGIVVVPMGIYDLFRSQPETLPKCRCKSNLTFIEGAPDNLPDLNAWNAAKQIRDMVTDLKADDLLLVLISGGGSALLPLPKEPITLGEKLWIIKELSLKGTNIHELNSVRKNLSSLKGGGLAEFAYPAKVVSLVLSDVLGDPLDFIASGPTTPNVDSSTTAKEIVEKYGIYENVPKSIKQALESAEKPHVAPVKHGQYEHVQNLIIGNNELAARAAKAHAQSLDYESAILSTTVSGNVEQLANVYTEIAARFASLLTSRKVRPRDREQLWKFLCDFRPWLGACDRYSDELDQLNFKKPLCLILAGEPTVVVTGTGKGGRNQQLALSFSVEVNKLNVKSAVDISFLSCGTDGIDGPTDAAGAIGGTNLLDEAAEQQIDPLPFLSDNDCYQFYSKFNGGINLIRIGHTGTNVMDIHVMIIAVK